MNAHARWARIFILAGLVIMILGALDPLEGSLLVAPGVALAALGAFLGKTRHRLELYRAFVLVVLGVGALWGLSVAGGFGGDTGRSLWWGLLILPYPLGWVLGMIGAVRGIMDFFRGPARSLS
ncbi:MAG TPA: hypothetical protein VFX92_04990 [Candidatus Krumholzibacteria bacterium]|nr:hypothetical protein [Candidatus Krumholzibacteria bacterium]